MKKLIPFKKDIIFKTKLSEITSISLENTLKVDDSFITGDFIISGEYKATEQSVDVIDFKETIPFEVAFDPKYDLANVKIEIDDFYYEIVNDSVLSIHIDVLVDNIEEQRCIEEETINEEILDKKETINIFNNVDIEDSFNTYKVYIVRDNDTLESILEKYNITKEELSEYNDLKELKIGDKLVIPVNEKD